MRLNVSKYGGASPELGNSRQQAHPKKDMKVRTVRFAQRVDVRQCVLVYWTSEVDREGEFGAAMDIGVKTGRTHCPDRSNLRRLTIEAESEVGEPFTFL